MASMERNKKEMDLRRAARPRRGGLGRCWWGMEVMIEWSNYAGRVGNV